MLNAPPGERVDKELENWVAAMRKKRTALNLPTIMQACPEFASWVRSMGRIPGRLVRSEQA